MQPGNQNTLTKSNAAMFVDHTLLVFICTDNEWLIRKLYDTLYVSPALYEYYMKTLDIDTLKIFKRCVKQIEENNTLGADDVIKAYPNLTNDEAFAISYARSKNIDLIMDDAEKAKIFASCGSHVVRTSDIIFSSVTTLQQE